MLSLHRISFAVCFSALTLSGLAAQAPTTPTHHIIKVQVKDVRQMVRLMKLDMDLASCNVPELGAKEIEVVATDADLKKLTKNGFRYGFLIRNWEAHYAKQLAKYALPREETLTPAVGKGGMGGHYTLKEIEAHLDAFAKNYPKICAKKVSIGKTIENRDIWMVKISDNVIVDEKEPKVLYDALHHAREPLSATTTLLFMDELLAGYGKDPEATFIINQRQLYFVPCVNPDGYEYNRSIRPKGGGMWRKNRRKNSSTSYGVDLNRNYSTAWTAPNGGNSTSPNSSTYRGTKAFSEPEAVALDALAKKHKFVQVNSCHTYTGVLLAPWGYQNGWPKNRSDYETLGKILTAENRIKVGPASTILYIAAGTALDHHHAAYGSITWTPELGKSSEGGFWPVGKKIEEIARRHQPMFRKIALTSGANLEVLAVTVRDIDGNKNGKVEPGETGEIVIDLQNVGLAGLTTKPQLKLSSTSSAVSISAAVATLPLLGKFAKASNSTSPLRFALAKNTTDIVIELSVVITSELPTKTEKIRLLLAPLRVSVDHDMEKARGFSRATGGTATTGLWERAAPQGTTYNSAAFQPGFQATPGGKLCWITGAAAGSSVGSNDVDGGYTDLVTPVMDLSHLSVVQIAFARWYAESVGDDDFEVAVSADSGKTWKKVFNSATSTSKWARTTVDVPMTPTKTMQFRFRAQDNSASLVEAGVDDFSIAGAARDGDVLILTNGVAGSTLRAGFVGKSGGVVRPLVSPKLGTGVQLPGIAGTLQLDPLTTLILAPVPIGQSGFAALDVVLPKITGATYYVQALYGDSKSARFGNVQTVVGK